MSSSPHLYITSTCVSCDSCRLICPADAVLTDGKVYAIDSWSCTLCRLCEEICPTESIKINDQIASED